MFLKYFSSEVTPPPTEMLHFDTIEMQFSTAILDGMEICNRIKLRF